MFKKLRKNEKGFTLAELLIVVAIIGVLVAISIPIFTAQLNKAKYAADLANARAIYAELQADYLASGEVQTVTADKLKIDADSADTIVLTEKDGTKNEYKFSGIVGINVTLGNTDSTTSTRPSVAVAVCTKANAAAVTFTSSTT